MIARIVELALGQRVFVLSLGVALLVGGLYAFHVLDVVAYPDPSPPMIEVITQYPGWSAEEIERQITIPLETILNGMPGLTDLRSISIFGLSDIKIYFDFDTPYFIDRQEVLNRLQLVTLPGNIQPQISPWSAIAEIYRYELVGPPGLSLSDLKAIQDWQLQRKFKQVRGVIDVTTYGGTTKEYHVEVDPRSLAQYNVTLAQVLTALGNSNANVGGNYLTVGPQSFNVRGVGLIKELADIENVVVVEKSGTPIMVKNVAKVSIGQRVRLGKVGIDTRDDVLEGVVLLQRGAKATPTLDRVKKKVESLNHGQLPPGVQIRTFYDRSDLIEITIRTVLEILAGGMLLVFLILFIFLGCGQDSEPEPQTPPADNSPKAAKSKVSGRTAAKGNSGKPARPVVKEQIATAAKKAADATFSSPARAGACISATARLTPKARLPARLPRRK